MKTLIGYLMLLVCWGAPALAGSPDLAEDLNRRGREAYDQARFLEARDLFKQAWEENSSGRYLYNAAKASLRLQEPEVAVYYFRAFLVTGPGADDVTEVEKSLETLRRQLADQGLVRVEINSEPPRGLVKVGGQVHPEIRFTPQERWLSPGTYQLRVELEGRSPREETLVVQAPEQSLRKVFILPEVPLEGRVRLTCREADARILVDGRDLGPGPEFVLAPGGHDLRAEKEGFLPSEARVMVRSGEVTELELLLIPREIQEPLPISPAWSPWKVAGLWTMIAGGVGLVTGGSLYLIGGAQMNSADPDDWASYRQDYNRGRELAVAGQWTMVASSVVGIGGGLMMILAPEPRLPVSLGPGGLLLTF